MSMLRQFDAELLIGQISYKQKAGIYVSKGYDTVKECTIEKVMIDKFQFMGKLIATTQIRCFFNNDL